MKTYEICWDRFQDFKLEIHSEFSDVQHCYLPKVVDRSLLIDNPEDLSPDQARDQRDAIEEQLILAKAAET